MTIRTWVWGGAVTCVAVCLVACSKADATAGAASAATVAARDTRIVHEDCEVNDSDAVADDVNGDGRPDRTTVVDGSRATCRALDFNFDGVIDAWVYLDGGGNVRRRESDYDRDGRVDEVALYRAGQLTERQRATTLAGKFDTWHFYEAGKVKRTERDSNGDDYVDQWWEYPAGRDPQCPLIHSDVDGDGRPDPGATVDVCVDRYTPTARDGSAAPGTPTESEAAAGDIPVETEPPTETTGDAVDAEGDDDDAPDEGEGEAP